jgi:hypothetical protein
VNDEFEWIWKESFVTYLRYVFTYAWEDLEKLQKTRVVKGSIMAEI